MEARIAKADSHLSYSIGVAFSPTDGTSYYDLFEHANQALYQAKELGKDRYVFYNSQEHPRHTFRQMAPVVKTRIDSEEQPGLATSGIVPYTFQRLYNSTDIESSINDVLELVERQLNVSRVYIFKNSSDNETCRNTFKWCNTGIASEKASLQNLSYETDIPNFEDNYNEDGIFYCPDISELPPTSEGHSGTPRRSVHVALRDPGQRHIP